MMERWRVAAVLAVLALLAVATLLPLSPAYPSEPNRDGGLFLYAGDQLLRGAVPYRDVWDHKPPLIFCVNAAGLALPLPSWWGVWLIETAMILGALGCSWSVLRRYGVGAAAVGSATWIAILFLCSIFGRGGNVTEPPALLFQFLALALWRGRKPSELSWRMALFIGFCSAAAFLLKPSLIGVWLAMAIVLLLDDARRSARLVLPAAAGAAMLFALFVVCFAAAHALGDAYDQVFRYNGVYTEFATAQNRVTAARFGIEFLARAGAFPAFVFWLFVVATDVSRRRPLDPLLWLAIIDLPIEIVLAALPGRTYEHYYVALLPPVGILTAAAASRLIGAARAESRRAAAMAVVLVAILACSQPLRTLRFAIAARSPLFLPYAFQRDRATDFVRRVVPPGQPVLIWGAEASINFLSGHPSPTRYAYLHPLLTTGYADARREREFLDGLRLNPPALIIDTSPTETLFPPLDARDGQRWVPWPAYTPPPEFAGVLAWIRSNYERQPTLALAPWSIYRPRREARSSGSMSLR